MPQSTAGVREIVVPGESVNCENKKPGFGIYKKGGQYYASRLGLRTAKTSFVDVIPLAGKYVPLSGDEIIGTVSGINTSSWLLDISSPYPALLHASESPWKVEFNATAKYLDIGDSVTAAILSVDDSKHVQVTMREQSLRKLSGGHIVEVPFGKVPRVIGKKGSMLEMLKSETGCKIVVGRNGKIWVDGPIEKVLLVAKAIDLIDREAQTYGLTDKVREFLRNGGSERV
ncbi:MAG: exosome complex protein Rrp4 [Thermoplasmata archaeon]|nr:exosome complex protein Rrp4 [Candidatus Sysuiplasma acidicola]MBX8646486.1 exosome complex protein Rrp4 [Candidatus Sysuiplasma acidicola]MDH2905464.1 exosome complex RNA-binding protein Rrp4 [Methanomassiliicoccales archaeon]